MTYQKPYTFRAGTYAKAAEVNANFDTIKNFMDGLEEQIGNVETSSAVYNKANINGNAAIKFNVADGTDANNAVNFGQLTGVSSRVSALEARNFAPNYSTYVDLTFTSGAFTQDGLLYVTNGNDSARAMYLDGTYFAIRAGSNMTFPVNAGTTYDFSSFTGTVTIRLFLY